MVILLAQLAAFKMGYTWRKPRNRDDIFIIAERGE
jgi:hypothetical protein